jgi:hypothetical protein
MKTSEENEPVSPKRLITFAKFFKNYMSVSTIVVAALPIPVTAWELIPTFKAQTKLLSVYTPLFCFLVLGFIFYSRHELARMMFPDHFEKSHRRPGFNKAWRTLIGILPLLLIATSIFAAFQYNDVLNSNVKALHKERLSKMNDTTPLEALNTLQAGNILQTAELNQLPTGSRLMLLYLLIFITAEAAFVLMAIKEYLQDLAGLDEKSLMNLSRPQGFIIRDDIVPQSQQPSRDSEPLRAKQDVVGDAGR